METDSDNASESPASENEMEPSTSSVTGQETKLLPINPSLKPKKGKKRSPGIIYLSSIPPFMGVKHFREILGQYGEMGHLFLQPKVRLDKNGKRKKIFTEGWVEFKDKKVAKQVAASLNNTMVGGRRRSRAYECLWNMKFLHRFKWIHLTEQLNYEKAVRKQRLRTEISQAKREANYFAANVDKGEHLKRLEEKVLKKGGLWEKYQRQITQRKPVAQTKSTGPSEDMLNMIF